MALAICAALSMAPVGCGMVVEIEEEEPEIAPEPAARSLADSETNDDFSEAQPLTLDPLSSRQVKGRIEWSGDLDLFELGPLNQGERLTVNTRADQGFTPTVALFNEAGDVLTIQTIGESGSALIEQNFTSDMGGCYLGVTGSIEHPSPGAYSLEVDRLTGADPEEPRQQVIYLNFYGADGVELGQRPPMDIPPMDAAQIDANWSGRTDDLIALVLELVREDYAGLEVVIKTGNGIDSASEEISIVHFGQYDASLFGAADGVDEGNRRPSGTAIVFVDSFTVFPTLGGTLEQVAQALANVASHEIGHMLGLNHTADPHGLMDITATLDRLMQDQWFTRSKLSPTVFPVGYQDAPAMLSATVGGKLEHATTQARQIFSSGSSLIPPAERPFLSTCVSRGAGR